MRSLACVVVLAACLDALACRMGFEPVDTDEPIVPGADAYVDIDLGDATNDAVPLGIPCEMRIPATNNAYVPRAECFAELDMARATCNADSLCVLTGWYWYPSSTGVNDTGACADGGGETGCRQWRCSTRGQLPMGHVEI